MKTTRKSITVKIPKHTARVFRFYAINYSLTPECVMQSEVFQRIGSITDDPFGILAGLDETAQRLIAEDDREEVALQYCPEAMDLLRRVSAILRRPVRELVASCLVAGADTLADYVQDALNGDGLHGENMNEWADAAIQFERMARQNRVPGDKDFDGWDMLNIQRPSADPSSSARITAA